VNAEDEPCPGSDRPGGVAHPEPPHCPPEPLELSATNRTEETDRAAGAEIALTALGVSWEWAAVPARVNNAQLNPANPSSIVTGIRDTTRDTTRGSTRPAAHTHRPQVTDTDPVTNRLLTADI
jgi:hypothetical protein